MLVEITCFRPTKKNFLIQIIFLTIPLHKILEIILLKFNLYFMLKENCFKIVSCGKNFARTMKCAGVEMILNDHFRLNGQNRYLNLVKILILAILMLPFTASAQFAGGDGSAEDPYTIATPTQLAQLATYVNANDAVYNAAGVYYKLVADIGLYDYGENFNDGQGWIPIGINTPTTARFRGIFDGNGKVIKGLYINNTTLNYIGLFGYSQTNAVIKNLGIENAEIIVNSAATPYVSGIIGYASATTLSNCWFKGSINVTANTTVYSGGIAGNAATTTLSNCWVSGSINCTATTTIYAGGITGTVATAVSSCWSACSINATATSASSNTYIGGISGDIGSGTLISNCYSTDVIKATSNTVFAGGIAGRNYNATVSYCWSISEINSLAVTTSNAGGLVGQITSASAKINNCVALNPYVNGTGTTRNVGRVAGVKPSGTLADNTALSVMLNLPDGLAWTDTALDQINGADISISSILSDGTLGGQFITSEWETETGMLPGLGQVVTPPSYLTGGAAVFGVSVSPKESVMKKGATQTFNATVLGFNAPTSIEWSVEGGAAGTTITAAGVLTVATDESALKIIVRATSTEDETKSGIATVNIIIYDGDGIENDPYIITTPAQLAQLAIYVNENNANFINKHYKLGNNIDLSEYGSNYNNGAGWTPIGTNTPITARFAGVFDGDGKTIIGLYINNMAFTYLGLFGYTQTNAVIKNLGIVDAEIISTRSVSTIYAGGLTGYASATTISNCWFTGSISAIATSAGYSGGISGYATASTNISNCYATCYISIKNGEDMYAGGITGALINNSVILNCWSSSQVHSTAIYDCYVGGISGNITGSSSISNCAALNPCLSGVGYIKRVVGSINSSTLSNNIAFNGMINLSSSTTWSDTVENMPNGADITSSEIVADGTLGSLFVSPTWTVQNGMLPGLGQAVTMPSYLSGGALVLSVAVSPKTAALRKGGSQTFSATITGLNSSGAITWSVEGGVTGTTITSGGVLSVATDETSIELTIKATSTEDNSKFDTAVVTLIPFDGEGIVNDPYIIATPLHLFQFATFVNANNTNFNNKQYKVVADIDLSDYGKTFNDGAGWVIIGHTSQFRGVFDGNGHKILNLYINIDTNSLRYAGLFGTIYNATIKNLDVVDAEINYVSTSTTSSYPYVGGLTGYGSGTSSITNCYFTGSITASGISMIYVGGIAGHTQGSSATNPFVVSNCSFSGTLHGISSNVLYLGGIIGYTNTNAPIRNCYTMGSIISDLSGTNQSHVGAIVGYASNIVSNCWSTAYVSNNTTALANVGGITGFLISTSSSISNCAALNPGINSMGTTRRIGRVLASNSQGTLTNNVAFADMFNIPVGTAWTNIGATLLDGENMTTTEILADGTLGGRFAIENGWTVEDGKLPGFGAAITPPDYLIGTMLIIDMVLNPNGTALSLGESQTFTATVFGHNITGNVNWSVEGGTTGTTITSGGLLTVATDETASSILVRATSTDDNTVSRTAEVIIFNGGDGTQPNPFIITTAAQLAGLSTNVNIGSDLRTKHFKLGNNIDLSGYGASFNDGQGWIRIGSPLYPFSGSFDGDNHIITGLYIRNTSIALTGLFGQLASGSVIKNLGLVDVDIYTTFPNVGSFAARMMSGSSVINCYGTGTINADIGLSSSTGGIAGNCAGEIKKCYFIGDVKTLSSDINVWTGGIAGNGGNISYCYFSGNVSGPYAAGITGYTTTGGLTSYCYSMGSVEVTGVYQYTTMGSAAGIAINGVVKNCWTTASVSSFIGDYYLQGYSGGISASSNTVSDCAALNSSINILSGLIYYGRISPAGSTHSNNVAFQNMLNPSGDTTWDNKGLNNLDGADISLQEINIDGTLGGRFKTEDGWIVENGKLPGLFECAVDFPPHLFLPTDIYTVSGKITAANAPDGVEDAVITITSPGFHSIKATSDGSGDYFIEQAYDTKIYNVKVEAIGYIPYISTITIASENVELDITLNEVPYPVGNVNAESVGNDAFISWIEPGETSILYRYDSGNFGGNGLGFLNGTRKGVVGSVYKVSSTLDKMSWYSMYESEVDVFVFGLNSDGSPNSNNIIFTAQNVDNNTNSWSEFKFSIPVYAPNGFYVAISASNGGNVALGYDIPNEEYPFKQNTHFYNSNSAGSFNSFEESNYYVNAMIRVEGISLGDIQITSPIAPFKGIEIGNCDTKSIENGEWRIENERKFTSHSSPLIHGSMENEIENTVEMWRSTSLNDDISINKVKGDIEVVKGSSKSLVSPSSNAQFPSFGRAKGGVYNIYRLHENQPETNWTLVAENVADPEYTDSEWADVIPGSYQYAVKTVYANDVISSAVLSNVIGKDWNTDFRINIVTNTGAMPAGAIVTMVHQDGNPEHIYTDNSDNNGVLFENIWRGVYYLTIKLEGFITYSVTVSTQASLIHDAKLFEKTYPATGISAQIVGNNAVVTWTAPIPNEEKTYLWDDGSAEYGYSISSDAAAWLGNRFAVNESGEISSIDCFGQSNSSNTNRLLTVDIFDENKNLIGSSAEFVLPTDAWINVPLDFIPFNGTFYAMVKWSKTSGSTNYLGFDENGPNINTTHSWYRYDSGEWVFMNSLTSGHPGVFLVRANVLVSGKAVSLCDMDNISNNRALIGYNVYRLLKGESQDNWETVANNVNALTYTDIMWSSLQMGEYQYAVKAIYTDDILSYPRYSNVLEKDTRVDYQINVLTNSGHPAIGAKVVLTNTDGNPDRIYTANSGTNGVLLENVWKGVYNLKVMLAGYESYFETGLNITTAGSSRTVTLDDIIFPISKVTAAKVGTDAVVTWTDPFVFTEKSYILDDGSGESGWVINSGLDSGFGNMYEFEEYGVITSVDVYGKNNNYNTDRKVIIRIYNHEHQLIGESSEFLIAGDGWVNVPLDYVEYSSTFYVFVWWPSTPGQTHYLGYDRNGAPGANLYHNATISPTGEIFVPFHTIPNDEQPGVFMIRVNASTTQSIRNFGLGMGNSIRNYELGIMNSIKNEELVEESVISEIEPLTSHSSPLIPESDSRAVKSYTVYRLLQGQPETAWEILTDVATELKYTDTEWSTLDNGTYQYAVKAIFGSGTSDATLSNFLDKENVEYFSVTVIAGEGGTVEIVGHTETSVQFEAGTAVTIKATPANQNWYFDNWTDESGTVSSNSTYTFDVTKDVVLTANFGQVGINENEIDRFTVYPNPTTSELRMENGELKMERIDIYNAVGQIVMEVSNVNATSYKLNVEMLSSGVYFISVQTKFGVIKSKFVVK